jgi:hypothetical protein
MGIRESLRDRYGVMTDDEAIRRAIEWYVPAFPTRVGARGSRGLSMG